MSGGGRLDRRRVFAWCLYDWANSAFPAVITTFVFATYVTEAVAPDPVSGAAAWAGATTVAGFVVAVLSPVLGAIADASGRQKAWLVASAAVMAAACASLWFVTPEPGSLTLALVAFATATIAFEISIVFYNALLPGVAPASHTGRVSGWGWGLGYVGGIVCLGLMLVAFVLPAQPWLGLDKASAEHVRISGPLTALWLIAFGAIYAVGTFRMTTEEVLIFGIALNLTAGLGAFGFAWVDDRFGSKRTIAVGLVALTLLGGGLLLATSKTVFWFMALAIGPFLGPVQAAGRSLCARLAPAERRAQIFGLFALSGRATAFLGPMTLGAVTVLTQSQRWGMATILPFFVVGLWLLLAKVRLRV